MIEVSEVSEDDKNRILAYVRERGRVSVGAMSRDLGSDAVFYAGQMMIDELIRVVGRDSGGLYILSLGDEVVSDGVK